MPIIKLPEVNNVYFKRIGVRNSVTQLLRKEEALEYNFSVSAKGYSIINCNGNDIYITSNRDFDISTKEYVLLSNKKATEEGLLSGEVVIKKWLKHPLEISYTTEEVRESWKGRFEFKEEDLPSDEKGLREPQIAALYSILGHLRVSEDISTVVMPTGTGKTETMLGCLVAGNLKKVLIAVPSDALRTQIGKKFYTLGLLKDFGILKDGGQYPKTGILYENFSNEEDLMSFIQESNVVITTMTTLKNNSEETLSKLNDEFSNLFIDEAHHVEATSWRKVRDSFENKKVTQFTATPFRNDTKRLEGKIIFNFSLKKAQEGGYFKPINFIQIREYDLKKGDEIIAEKAVNKLREDIQNGKNHILMARVKNTTRANEVFQIYRQYEEYNPVVIHSQVLGKKEILNKIINGEHKIIIAINMLGEGFDLPQLKIAAFHDIRKSLPITLQFAGRFTRTAFDEQLGNATFVANLASSETEDELAELYSQDSDWNLLLSSLSSEHIEEQISFSEFMQGFESFEKSRIPFQNIKFAFSTVVYKNTSTPQTCNLENFREGLTDFDDLEYKFYDINRSTKTLIIITAAKSKLDWVNYKEIYGLDWQLSVVFYDEANKLLFIHSSDKKSLYGDLAKSIVGNGAVLINQLAVFRSYYGIDRPCLQNVGLKEFLNRKIRFTMRVGTDIQDALSIAEQQRGEKAFVFGSGYENGEKITLGCSYKGRIWSYFKGDLKGFISWCKNLGTKLINEDIDGNQIMRDTLVAKIISEFPNITPTHIDWNVSFYMNTEFKVDFDIDGVENSAYCSLEILEVLNSKEILFQVTSTTGVAKFKKILFTETDEDGKEFHNFKISKMSEEESSIIIGSRQIDLEEYFNKNPPTIWFCDGSSLEGNEYIELKNVINPYPTERLIVKDWSDINISNESQHVEPLVTDSIQYKMIQELVSLDYDIVYDDDYSGEIADIITIKENDDSIEVEFYHLKYASGGVVNNSIENFYQVCGQAQKSIHWKHKSGLEFFQHLLRRKIKNRRGYNRSRLEKGTEADLERMLQIAKNQKPMIFSVFIVQPSLSKQNPSEDILTLLGVTENYLKELGDINLKVIVSE